MITLTFGDDIVEALNDKGVEVAKTALLTWGRRRKSLLVNGEVVLTPGAYATLATHFCANIEVDSQETLDEVVKVLQCAEYGTAFSVRMYG